MSKDKSGSLLDGTTPHAQVTDTCLPALQYINKTPIFITVTSDIGAFLAWLRASFPDGLSAQLKDENLMVILSNVNGFRPEVHCWKGRCDFPQLLAPGGSLCAATGEESGVLVLACASLKFLLLLLLLLLLSSSSLVTCHFFLVLLLNKRWSPPLRLQASHFST